MEPQTTADLAEELEVTTSLIVRLSTQLDEAKAKHKNMAEMYRAIFDNDPVLAAAKAAAAVTEKQVKEAHQKVTLKQPVIDLKIKMSDLNEDIKLIQESLNTHLLNYYKITNVTYFDVSPNEEREYVVRARVKGAAKRKASAPVGGQKDIFGGEAAQAYVKH